MSGRLYIFEILKYGIVQLLAVISRATQCSMFLLTIKKVKHNNKRKQ